MLGKSGNYGLASLPPSDLCACPGFRDAMMSKPAWVWGSKGRVSPFGSEAQLHSQHSLL
jgi:hypothetical protein